jgi:hypothetical protein
MVSTNRLTAVLSAEGREELCRELRRALRKCGFVAGLFADSWQILRENTVGPLRSGHRGLSFILVVLRLWCRD